MRIRFEKLPMGTLMRDKEIGMEYSLYREDNGVVLGYVKNLETAREISQSSGCVVPPGEYSQEDLVNTIENLSKSGL